MAWPASAPDIRGAVECAVPMPAGFEAPAPPRYCFDATLLFRCMEILRIDRRRLADDDPLLFRELQAVCALCRSKAQCLQDLAEKSLDPGCDDWGCYCPNAAMLASIGAAQTAGRGVGRVEAARLSGLSRLR